MATTTDKAKRHAARLRLADVLPIGATVYVLTEHTASGAWLRCYTVRDGRLDNITWDVSWSLDSRPPTERKGRSWIRRSGVQVDLADSLVRDLDEALHGGKAPALGYEKL